MASCTHPTPRISEMHLREQVIVIEGLHQVRIAGALNILTHSI